VVSGCFGCSAGKRKEVSHKEGSHKEGSHKEGSQGGLADNEPDNDNVGTHAHHTQKLFLSNNKLSLTRKTFQ